MAGNGEQRRASSARVSYPPGELARRYPAR